MKSSHSVQTPFCDYCLVTNERDALQLATAMSSLFSTAKFVCFVFLPPQISAQLMDSHSNNFLKRHITCGTRRTSINQLAHWAAYSQNNVCAMWKAFGGATHATFAAYKLTQDRYLMECKSGIYSDGPFTIIYLSWNKWLLRDFRQNAALNMSCVSVNKCPAWRKTTADLELCEYFIAPVRGHPTSLKIMQKIALQMFWLSRRNFLAAWQIFHRYFSSSTKEIRKICPEEIRRTGRVRIHLFLFHAWLEKPRETLKSPGIIVHADFLRTH